MRASCPEHEAFEDRRPLQLPRLVGGEEPTCEALLERRPVSELLELRRSRVVRTLNASRSSEKAIFEPRREPPRWGEWQQLPLVEEGGEPCGGKLCASPRPILSLTPKQEAMGVAVR